MFTVSAVRAAPPLALRALARPFVQVSRALPARFALMTARQTGPRAMFLPSSGRDGAALLRIYNVAERICDHGWQAIVLPRTLSLAQRRRLLAAGAPDIVVMQGVRHALNRPALYPEARIVMDLDDADFHLPHLAAPLTRAMGQVQAVIAGSDYVADWCRKGGAPAVHKVLTGMPVSTVPRPAQTGRPPVVAWAQTRPMTYVHEAKLVRDVMAALTMRVPGVRLRLYDRRPGDDPAFLAGFEAAGIQTEWVPAMPLDAYLTSFDDVAIGLAPLSEAAPFSRGKSVGKVLGYLDRHVPVIASDRAEHGHVFDAESGVLSNDPDVWVDRGAALLRDPAQRSRMAAAGFEMFTQHLSDRAMGAEVARILQSEVAPAEGQGAQKSRR